MNLLLVASALLFSAFTVSLAMSKYERLLGVFFIIRSSHGIRLIDAVAKIKPRLWEFLADFSVLLSFGGVGAFYLSSHKQSRNNTHKAFLVIGLMFTAYAILIGRTDVAWMYFLLAVLLAYAMPKLGNPGFDFAFTWAFFSLGFRLQFDSGTSVIFGLFGLPALMVYLLFTHGMNILASKTNLPGISPMLPAERNGNVGVKFPGYDIFIPWWHALIALFITLVAHEGAHGVLVRTAKVNLKSTGVLSFLAMPIGAFVEPDEDELKRKSSVDRMRVFTMGSFANLTVGFAAATSIILMLNVLSSVVYSDGMKVVGFMDGYPAKKVLPQDTVVYAINGKKVADLESFRNVTAKMRPGMNVRLNTSNGFYQMRLSRSDNEPKRGILGVYITNNPRIKGGFIGIEYLIFILETLGWIAFFNINIALVNLLPIIPFDGGRMFKEVVTTLKMSEKNMNRLLYASIGLVAVLFIVNAIPLLKMLLDYVISLT